MANGREQLIIEAQGEFLDLLADLRDLQGELDDTSQRAKRLGENEVDLDTSEAQRKVRQIQREFIEFARDAEDPVVIQARAEAAQREIRELRKDFADLQGAARRASREIRRIEQGRGPIKNLAVDVKSFSAEIKSASGALSSFIGNLSARAVERFFDALRDGIVSAVKTKAELEGLQPALRGVAGGFDGAAQSMEFLDGVSDRLARPLSELVPGFVKLSAATKDTRAEGELTRRLFEGLNAAVVATGAGVQQAEGAMLGLSQIAGGPVLRDMENVRQVTDALPGVMAAWAKELGVTQEELRELVESGTKPTEEALEALARAFEKIGGAGVDERLDTLAGKFGQLRQAGEELGQAFADEIDPGLKSVLDRLLSLEGSTNAAAAAIGAAANVQLAEFADWLRKVDLTLETVGVSLASLGGKTPFREIVADALKFNSVLRPLGVALDEFGDNLEGLPEKGSKAFDAIVRDAVLASQGITDATSEAAEGAAQDFVGLSEKAKESFRKQAEAAGLSAAEIEKIERQLGEDLVRINDETAKRRETLRDLRIRAERDQVDEIEQIEETLARAVGEIIAETEEQRREAIAERVRQAQEAAKAEEEAAKQQAQRLRELQREAAQAAEERVEKERQAEEAIDAWRTATQEKTIEAFRTFTETAVAEADKRRAAEEALSDDLVKIEGETSEKKNSEIEKFLEKVKKAGVDREKVESDLTDKLVEIESDANRKREAALRKRLEEVEKAADEEIKHLERVRKATEKLVVDLDKLFEGIGDAADEGAAGAGKTGGQRLPVEESLARAGESAAALRAELDQLQFGESGSGLDPDRILAVSSALADTVLGVQDFGTAATGASEEYTSATESMRDRAGALKEAIRELAFENEAFADVFPTLSERAQEALGRILQSYQEVAEGGQVSQQTVDDFKAAIEAWTGTAEGASGGAETLAGRLQELAGGAEEAGEKAQQSAEGIRAAAAGIELAAGASEEARANLERWKGEAEEAAKKIEGTGEKAEGAAEGVLAGGEAAAEAAEGVGELGSVAGEAAASVGAVADAAARLAETQVPPELPEQLAGIGQAATATAEAAAPLGESLVAINGQLVEIQATVASLSEAAPELTALVEEGSTKLSELVEGEVLTTIAEQIVALKEGLDGVGPLSEQVATSFTTIGEQGEPVAEAVERIKEGLSELGAEDLLAKIEALLDLIKGLEGPTSSTADNTERLKENIRELADFAETAKTALEGLATLFEEQLPAAVEESRRQVDGLREDVNSLRSDAESALSEIVDGLGPVREELQGAAQDAATLAQNLRDAAAAQRELNEAAAESNPEEG